MLPDFLTLKLELSKSQSYTVTHDRSGEPLLSKIASHINHEGKGFILMREDGSRETIDFQKTSAEIRIDMKDMQSKGERAIDEALNSANKQIHETQKRFCSKLSIEQFQLMMPVANRYRQN